MAALFVSAAEIGLASPMTLPREYYTSQEIFAQEHERIFLQRWLCVGREEQIAAPGDYFVRDIGDESVIILRDAEGGVGAFHNVCRHRGTRICDEATGTFDRFIRCPYHVWTYALDGRLHAAPSMNGAPGFDTKDYPLHKVPVALWEGFIFIWLGDNPQPFEETHSALIGKFTQYNMPALIEKRRVDYDVRANWKLLFENYSECYHCSPVHPTLVKISPANSGMNDLMSGPFLGGYMDVKSGGMSLTGNACAIPVGHLDPENLSRVYYYTLFPNMFLSLHADYVMVHLLWPQSPERTLIECSFLFHPDAESQPGFNPDDGVEFWDRTNREDWHVNELSQRGVSSRAYTPGPYSPRESLSAAFDREVLDALS